MRKLCKGGMGREDEEGQGTVLRTSTNEQTQSFFFKLYKCFFKMSGVFLLVCLSGHVKLTTVFFSVRVGRFGRVFFIYIKIVVLILVQI